MTDHLYRFRSIDKLLGEKFQELENQQIYFCPPDQLNDPLEGFKDIFWRGDQIAWCNLLRHYMLCLLQATSISAIMGEEFTPDLCAVLVHHVDSDLPQAPIREVYAAACNDFLPNAAVRKLIAALSAEPRAVRRDELIFYLRMLQPLAISKVLAALGQHGMSILQNSALLDTMIGELVDEI